MALHQPFGADGIQLSGFRVGIDYRKSDAWQSLKQAQAETLVALAKSWINAAEYADQGTDLRWLGGRFYQAVLEAAGFKLQGDAYAASEAYHALHALPNIVKSGAIVLPERSSLHAALGEINRSEARIAQEIRNAALQEARAEIDRAPGKGSGQVR